jgi:putative multiple sugar transport system permease protein
MVGLIVGIWQGYWIGYVRIPPFITTLAGMFIFRGIGRLVLDSKTVPIKDKAFTNLFTSYINIPGLDVVSTKANPVDNPHIWSPLVIGGIIVVLIFVMTVRSRLSKKKNGYQQNIALIDYGKAVVISALIMWYCNLLSQYKGISVMLIWVLAICLIYHFITSKTAFGRYFYAVGGNEKATRLSGIDTNRVYFLAYSNMGLLAGLCGLLCLARVGSVSGQTGTSFEMDAIASCFIGGASASGGSGSIGGVVIGAMLLGVLNMGMSIMGITDSWQYVVKGGVLLVAVIFDVVSSRKSGK